MQAYAMERGTWLDPEERSYPSGGVHSGRRARAIMPDGKLRIVRCGVADTWFSIPAYCKGYGRGFLTIDDGAVTFHRNKHSA